MYQGGEKYLTSLHSLASTPSGCSPAAPPDPPVEEQTAQHPPNKQTNEQHCQPATSRSHPNQANQDKKHIFESEWNPDEAAVAAEGAPVWSSSPGPGCAATGGKGSFMATWWTVRRRHAIPTTPICVSAKETKYFIGWPRTQPPKQEECLRLHDR